MNNFKSTGGLAFTFNLRDAVPQAHQAFKHSLEHSRAPLTERIEKWHKQTQYGLNGSNSAALQITLSDLAVQRKQVTSSLLSAFEKQSTARKNFANDRARFVRMLAEPDRQGTASVLGSFKAAVSVLPDSGIETGHSCCEPETAAQAPALENTSEGCSHDHDGGVIAVDLDEAAHGAFAVSKHLADVAKGNPQAVAESFRTSAAELSAEPVRYLGKELTQSGVGEFASSVGAAGVLLPLAGLAVKGGIDEWRHGSHEVKHLRHLRATQAAELETLIGTEQLLPGAPMQSQIQAQRTRMDKTQEALENARKTKQIGISSAGSGFFIGLKGSSDIALKTSLGVKGALTEKGFFALNESAQVGTAAGGAAVGLGIVSTLVVSPLAGVCAAGLGAFFTAKSVKKLSQLRSDYDLLKADIRADTQAREWCPNPEVKNLREFLVRQGDKRVEFFGTFSRWNQGFMVGSGLYASSAITKAVVTGLAIGGVTAAASNPVGLAVITGVGITGAAGMGIASLSFFRGHGKQSKYSSATASDHDWVDRRLMTDLHAMRIGSVNPTALHGNSEGFHLPSGCHPGFDMASSCLSHLDAKKAALKDFLAAAATKVNKRSPLEKNLSWWQHLGGRVLSAKDVQRFLKSDDGAERFNELVCKSLTSENCFLSEKINQRQNLINYFQLSDSNAKNIISELQSDDQKQNDSLNSLNHLVSTLERLDRDFARDQGSVELNLLRLKELASNSPSDPVLTASYINAGDNQQDIGKFLRKGFYKEIRKARNVLFESQLEGARLHELQYREQSGTQTGRETSKTRRFWQLKRPAAQTNINEANAQSSQRVHEREAGANKPGWTSRIFQWQRQPQPRFRSERLEI